MTWKTAKGLFKFAFQGTVKLIPLALFGCFIFLVFWGIRAELYADPGFQIENVEIFPETALPHETLQALEKLYLGQNLFKISLQKAAAEVEQNARIREARVTREFPRTLRIQIVERAPFAQVFFQPKGPYYVTGEDGVVIEAVLSQRSNLLPVEVLDGKPLKPAAGDKLTLDGLKEGIQLVKAFWEHPLAESEQIDRLRIDRLGNSAILLRKGPELRFGHHPLKRLPMLTLLKPLLEGPDRDRIVYIDLQYQDLVVKKK